MKISYSPESIGDLIRLRKFIDSKNPKVAQKIALSLNDGISQLKSFPLLGVEVELAPEPEKIRDLIVGNYIARYLTHSKQIYILHIWHHKNDRL